MSDVVYGYTIAVMAVIMLLCLGMTWHQSVLADRAMARAAKAERSLAVIRERVEHAGAGGRNGSAWRRPATERFDEHTNRALRINDPEATQLNFRDMT
jgi:hypothetical protein